MHDTSSTRPKPWRIVLSERSRAQETARNTPTILWSDGAWDELIPQCDGAGYGRDDEGYYLPQQVSTTPSSPFARRSADAQVLQEQSNDIPYAGTEPLIADLRAVRADSVMCQRHGRRLLVTCPDCVAEERLRRLEMTDQRSSHQQRGQGAKDTPQVVAAELGDMIDAIIIEHRGSLEKVITNLGSGEPRASTIQRLAEELLHVARTLTDTATESTTTMPKGLRPTTPDPEPEAKPSSSLFGRPMKPVQSTQSIPELIEMINLATEDLGRTADENEELLQDRTKSESHEHAASNESTRLDHVTSTDTMCRPTLLPKLEVTAPVEEMRPQDVNHTTHGRCFGSAIRDDGQTPATDTHRRLDPSISAMSRVRASLVPRRYSRLISKQVPVKLDGDTAPWPMRGGPSGFRPVVASRVKHDQRNKPGTFVQPWVKELSREAAQRERDRRRAELDRRSL